MPIPLSMSSGIRPMARLRIKLLVLFGLLVLPTAATLVVLFWSTAAPSHYSAVQRPRNVVREPAREAFRGDRSANPLAGPVPSSWSAGSAGRRELCVWAALLIGFAAVVATTSAAVFTNRLTRRMTRLATIAREFAGGRSDARAEIPTRDELGDVAAAFNEVADRVVERTAELARVNAALQAEIAERRRVEAALATRSRLAALTGDVGAALTKGTSLGDMLQGCAAALVQHLDAAFARIWTLNADGTVLELQASAGLYTHLDGPHGRVPVGQFKIGLIAEERTPHLTNNVLEDPRVGDREWARREGMVAFAGYPLLVNDRVVGVMALFARHPLPETTLQWMGKIGDAVAVGIERMRAAVALREGEQRMRLQSAALAAAANGVAITDRSGRIQWINRAFTELTGYESEEVIGRNPRILNSGRHDRAFYQDLWTTIASGRVWKGDLVNKRKNGELYHEEMTITPVRNGEGVIAHYIAIKQDVSERKRIDTERVKFEALLEASHDFIGMCSLEGAPFYLNRAGREMVGIEPDRDLATISILDYSDSDTAAMIAQAVIPATRTAGQWIGEGVLRNVTTRRLTPVHMHSFVVADPRTRAPLCLGTIQRDISDIKAANARLEAAHRGLLDASRLSGMAEVATSVLHNVGNVLNSVNVSTDRIAERVRRLRPASVDKVAGLLREHADDLAGFLSRDPRGRELPAYLRAVVDRLADPEKDILAEIASLRKNVDHIREIVRMQQSYARVSGVSESVALSDLVEDGIRINAAAMSRRDVVVIREYAAVPPVTIDKHKVLQILVNLLSNATHALDGGCGAHTVTVRVEPRGAGAVAISVSDTGVGIAPENLTRIFQHGFTTRPDGHGFGLHSGALAARELGGSLTVSSDGPGRGATFTLELPRTAGQEAA